MEKLNAALKSGAYNAISKTQIMGISPVAGGIIAKNNSLTPPLIKIMGNPVSGGFHLSTSTFDNGAGRGGGSKKDYPQTSRYGLSIKNVKPGYDPARQVYTLGDHTIDGGSYQDVPDVRIPPNINLDLPFELCYSTRPGENYNDTPHVRGRVPFIYANSPMISSGVTTDYYTEYKGKPRWSPQKYRLSRELFCKLNQTCWI